MYKILIAIDIITIIEAYISISFEFAQNHTFYDTKVLLKNIELKKKCILNVGASLENECFSI